MLTEHRSKEVKGGGGTGDKLPAVFRSRSRSRSQSRPEPAFLAGAGAGAEKNTKCRLRLQLRLRLRLLVNCKAENYEFVTTEKKIFSSPIQNYRIYMFDFRNNFLYQGRRQGFGSAFFFADPDPLGIRGRGVGVKGKNNFFLVITNSYRIYTFDLRNNFLYQGRK